MHVQSFSKRTKVDAAAPAPDASLSESTIEEIVSDWLASLGWAIRHGPDIASDTPNAERDDYREVILE